MAIADTIRDFLGTHRIQYDLVRHPREVTAARVAQSAHIPGNQVAKAVLLEDENGYLIAVVPSTHRIDLGKLHHQLDRRVGLAVESEATALFPDCDAGVIPPVGTAYRIETIIDDSLLQQPDIYFEAGDHEALVHMSGAAFGRMMDGLPHSRFSHHL